MMRIFFFAILSVLFNRSLCLTKIIRDECPPLPTTAFAGTSKLPNPFLFLDGTTATTRAQWNCRRTEIRKLILDIEFGPLPPPPPVSNMSVKFIPGTLNNGTINITITGEKRNVTLALKIVFPNDTSTPNRYPVVITPGTVSMIPLPEYAASIYWNQDDFAALSQRGSGRFFDLYPAYRSTTGSWAGVSWGVSRIIDALELLEGEINIDTKRIAISGCSRYGRTALISGALDDRVALTIAQESGEGGDMCWRVLEYEKSIHKIGNCDPVECPPDWTPYAPNFGRSVSKLNDLPFDHHTLAALIAPRGLLIIGNDIDWLRPSIGFSCMSAARKVWEALGAKGSMGWTMDGSHNHCAFPKEKQGAELNAFFDKFLGTKDGSELNVWRNMPEQNANMVHWVDWLTPNLG
jgi:hypothetical protein